MAKKRGFGPFGAAPPERATREKQIAAMLRAGHPLDSARELVDAASVEAAEDWAAQITEDE
jgi:regulatory protein